MVMRPSFENVSTCIGELYEASCGERDWSGVIDHLGHLFDASKACLVRQGPDLSPADTYNPDADDYFLRMYIDQFHRNELADIIDDIPVGQIYNDHTLLGPGGLRRTRVWNEWMAPQDMYDGLACKLIQSGHSYWFFDLQRGRNQKTFGNAEVELMSRILPHVKRAAQISRNQQLAGIMSHVFTHLPYGVVIVDSSMRVLSSNDAAGHMLERPTSPLKLRGDLLQAVLPADRAQLQRLVAQACMPSEYGLPGTGSDLLIRDRTISGPQADLVLTITPVKNSPEATQLLEPSATIHIRQLTPDLPEGFESYMRLIYRLSPKEARVASRLALGLSLKDAAAEEGIAISTARTYMEHLFQKTGTHQQSALVALLKSLQSITFRQ